MKKKDRIKQIAVEVIQNESEAIIRLPEFIDDQFVECVELIHKSKGRVIITGFMIYPPQANKIHLHPVTL